jgi:hypothetical protein
VRLHLSRRKRVQRKRVYRLIAKIPVELGVLTEVGVRGDKELTLGGAGRLCSR